MIDLGTVSALFEAVTKTHYVNHQRGVRVRPHLHRLRGPAIAAIERRLDRAQPHPLVVALGERQQGVDQLIACSWKAARRLDHIAQRRYPSRIGTWPLG